MATRTRTTQATKTREESQQAINQPRPLLADHPGYIAVNPTFLSAPLRAPTGVTYFATAQPEEMIQRPIYSSPSLQSQVLLGGLAAGLEGGAKAHMKMGLVQEAKKETPLDQCMKVLDGGVSIMSLMIP
ncbi:hypothetical protein ST47_g3993 [Ascochyta rabiei]|uniref:Uncharacterized protein n=1 Tax=Didymella rabiei TaxID=5454 RepID=A0A163GHY8_DIDRA|nr:hypothetical protein ST47_g3993 [Ascochyta rabiei]